ncbi:hypothetical protein ANN_11076 [Periplaneta americana]|uniref:Uncharacterized protein n=1 Tax=Periplaneta americana TaxID=6978 RepID=A0ABQ8T6B5_PERAM|nr:hypothetical protein ANN_11076 [Periplaneta americana]
MINLMTRQSRQDAHAKLMFNSDTANPIKSHKILSGESPTAKMKAMKIFCDIIKIKTRETLSGTIKIKTIQMFCDTIPCPAISSVPKFELPPEHIRLAHLRLGDHQSGITLPAPACMQFTARCRLVNMECGVKENRIAVLALHKCSKTPVEIFNLLRPLKITKKFVYLCIIRYTHNSSCDDRARSYRLRKTRTPATIAVAERIRRNPHCKQKLMGREMNIAPQTVTYNKRRPWTFSIPKKHWTATDNSFKWSKASYLGLALRNARWFESSLGKKFSHEISANVWDRCPPSIVMLLGSYDRFGLKLASQRAEKQRLEPVYIRPVAEQPFNRALRIFHNTLRNMNSFSNFLDILNIFGKFNNLRSISHFSYVHELKSKSRFSEIRSKVTIEVYFRRSVDYE